MSYSDRPSLPPRVREEGSHHANDHDTIVDFLGQHEEDLELVADVLLEHIGALLDLREEYDRHERFLNRHGWLIVLQTLAILILALH